MTRLTGRQTIIDSTDTGIRAISTVRPWATDAKTLVRLDLCDRILNEVQMYAKLALGNKPEAERRFADFIDNIT